MFNQTREGSATLVIQNGVIDDMRKQRIKQGYHRLFTIRWYRIFENDIQNHELPVSAFNEVARIVRGEGDLYIGGFNDGDIVNLLGELKTHKGEIYLELRDIQRAL
jgi:hypothetical protein